MRNNLFVFSGLLFFSLSAQAASWTGPVTIDDIYVWDSTYINIRVSPYVNPDNCTDQQGYMLSPATDTKWADRMYSQILAAYTTGKKLSFMLDGCGSKAKIRAVSFTHAKS